MSGIEGTCAAGTAGKDTPTGGQPSGATSTHAVVTAVMPHLAYGDAIHAELGAWELRPERMDAGVSTAMSDGQQELFLRIIWPVGHDDLGEDVRADGLTLAWSHMTGWTAHTADGELLLDVDEFAAPSVVAEAALHLAEDGLHCGWTPGEDAALWEHAAVADIALVLFDEGGR
ncbi:hypothetical protein [Streptomyces graminilatus]|uniref:hypothetical protein n=1 Tax=Streptomyces graminilatus TaxID=1464070 RepID=UPI0006E2B6AA|nr:hypothetical protein [Streptomyces graminilatus]